MTLILDAGALIALEKNDKAVWKRFNSAILAGFPPVTHGGIVGQAGRLLGRSGARDVIDAALVLLAEDGDEIITSDPSDLAALSAYTGIGVELISV